MKKAIITLFTFTTMMTITIAYIIYDQWQPRALKEPVAFSIQRGQSFSDIANALKREGLIEYPFLFEAYGKIKGYDRKISEGKHYFSSTGMNKIYEQLMSKGKAEKGIVVTIPEGFTVPQIAKKLDAAGIVEEEQFLEVAKTGKGLSDDLLNEIPVIEGSNYRLEGYFFPDTYHFKPNTDAIKVSERMISRFYEVVQSFGEKPPLTLHEWVTLASIVEREAVLQKERPMIAGVFYNRLEQNWKLQACATVLYAIGKPKNRLLYEDLEIVSPYNTYMHKGLPVGPIASPGKESLKAVLDPAEHEFFFYVVKGDGSGGHNFSKTYSQHNDYKREALKQH